MGKLFLSHANHDLPLVQGVVDLLESGIGVPHKMIFCSSFKGQSIHPGEDFVDSIHEQLDDADLALALISEAYYASAFCMCELGGIWLQKKSFLPVLVARVDYKNLKAVLGGLHVSRVDKEEDLDELRDEIIRRLRIEGHATPRWNLKRKKFLETLPDLLTAVAYEGPVPREKYDRLRKEKADYKKEFEACEREVQKLNEVIAELKKLKDAQAVHKVLRARSTSGEVFEELAQKARRALGQVRPAACEALYYRCRGEEYFPKGEEAWESVQCAAEEGEVEAEDERPGVSPNEQHRHVGKAARALDELGRWLASAPEDFGEWYDAETKGQQPDLKLRTFWRRHLQ